MFSTVVVHRGCASRFLPRVVSSHPVSYLLLLLLML
ncbi:unnamed protein product [Amoebophrya sp. A120]|nr:unnamed protein product [Amoebophrya sp. A120]CAD7947653.1 unnamed protein product [Amoebophrya sp. A120]|eukprot:GSA120T00017029001.1